MAKVNMLCYAIGVLLTGVALTVALTLAQDAWKADQHVRGLGWSFVCALLVCGAIFAGTLPIALEADATRAKAEEPIQSGRDRGEPRAWVGPTLFSTRPQHPTVGQPFGAEVTIKNYGRTPALNIRGNSVFEPVQPGQVPNFNYAADPSFTIAIMQPDAEHFTQHTISRRRDGSVAPLDQTLVDALRAGRIRLAAHGRLTYEDVSGRRHWVEWCQYLSADFQSWNECGSHNGIGTEQATEVDQSRRAWLTVKSVTLMQDFAVGKRLNVVLTVTNTGTTPAIDVVITGDVVSRQSIDAMEFDTNTLASPPPSMMVIAPGAVVTVPISSEGAPIASQEHIDAFVSGSYTVFARGFILYKDVDGKTHKTVYCFKARGTDFHTMSTLGVGMSACERWNTVN